MNTPTDKEIVRRVLRGDVECFSGVVREYSPRMLSLAAGIVGTRDAAEDVVQDALLKAYEKLDSWRGESSLSTWLYRIVYTTAVSSLRGRHDVHTIGDEAAPDMSTDGDDKWETTEENIARMRRALDSLPPMDRTLVDLFYIEDRSIKEVAEICSLSEANVKTRLHRARTRLKNIINAM